MDIFSKFRLGVENFVQQKILSIKNFVQYFNTKVRQKSQKIVEISLVLHTETILERAMDKYWKEHTTN